MKPIETHMLSDGRKLEIYYDSDLPNPREWAKEHSMLCIRKHRKYDFPNELDYDFDGEEPKNLDKYHVFWLSCYIHSGVSFSLRGDGINCAFDTSDNCGFIAIDKGHTEDKELARELAKSEIEDYNKYLNGEGYGYRVFKKETWTNSKGESKDEREEDESVRGFYEKDAILEEYKSLLLS